MTDAGDALLALLNTRKLVDGAPADLLDGAWLRSHGAGGQSVADARRLRDDLRSVVSGEASADVLADRLRDVRRTPAVSDDGITWTLHADWSARMVLAWGEIHSDMPGRLRPCANDDCLLFLLDRSRSGTGRWCSMAECGNRMKARRHYSRARQG